ncbi:DUF6580 family putative transport protein [Ohtaekwangia sp.]|uniref:DUF6580 family putative transport protein n=1 Tax=Ohtaekwangia sp. TaxID=2066019 RepID=UPI002F959C03
MNKINPRPVILAAFILAAGIFRLATASTHSSLSSFTPLGAMALFGGFYYSDKWKAYLLPLLTLWLTDIILNRFLFFGYWVLFYQGAAWVYGSFAFMVFIGQQMKTVSVRNIAIACVAAAVSHWLITDFSVWLSGCTGTSEDIPYTKDFSGLIDCYTMALPSMRNLLIGNIVFSTIFFGSFELMQRRFPALSVQ